MDASEAVLAVRVANHLYNRDEETGRPCRDGLINRDYPVIPLATHFQGVYGRCEVPHTVFGWQWSVTFNRWSALVRLADGWQGFTFPIRSTGPAACP